MWSLYSRRHSRIVGISSMYSMCCAYGRPGIEVADVPELRVPDGPHHVVGLVHPIPVREDVLARGRLSWTEERPPLHVRRNGHAGQRQHGGAKVHQADEVVDDGARRDCAGPAHDERHLEAGVVDEPLAPRQSAAVIAPEEDDGAVRQPVVFELLEDGLHLAVHRGDEIVVPAPSPSGPAACRDSRAAAGPAPGRDARRRERGRDLRELRLVDPDLALVRGE